MKITAKSEYACLAVLALAQHGSGIGSGADPGYFGDVLHSRAIPGADPASN